MRPFRDQSIERKVLTLALVPTVLALVMAIVTSLLSTYFTARRNQNADVAALDVVRTAAAAKAWRSASLWRARRSSCQVIAIGCSR